MDLEDVQSTGLVRQWDLNLSVESTWPQECRIESVEPIRGYDGLNLSKIIESIKLVQQLHECSLDFTVGTRKIQDIRSLPVVDNFSQRE